MKDKANTGLNAHETGRSEKKGFHCSAGNSFLLFFNWDEHGQNKYNDCNTTHRFLVILFVLFPFFLFQSIRTALKLTSLAKRIVECTRSIPMVWEILKCTAIMKRVAEVGRSFKRD